MESKKWQDVISIDKLEKGDVTNAQFGTKNLAIYDAKDGIFVSLSRCTHGAANLCDGYFDGTYIECPLHLYRLFSHDGIKRYIIPFNLYFR